MTNEFKLGFGFYGGHPLETVIELAKKSEGYGLDSCWIAEDYFYGGAFSTAASCAMHTDTIKIGIGVVNPFTRHPLLTAMEAVALDTACKGRLMLGIGASNIRWIQNMAGIPYVKPIQATKEMAQIIKGFVRDRRIKFDGEVFQTGECALEIEPYRTDLPIIMGVKGPRALFAAGQIADGVLLSTMTSVEYVKYAKEQIRQGAESVGRNPDEIKIAAYFPLHIDSDSSKAKAKLKGVVAKFIGIHGFHPIMFQAGLTEEYIAPFKEAVAKGIPGSMIGQVTDEVVDKLCIAGTAKECKDKLRSLIDAGVDMPVAFEVEGVDPMETLELIAKNLLN